MTPEIALLQFTTGLFFFATGLRKTFVPQVRERVFALFASKGVPKAAGVAVVGGELFGGLALLLYIAPGLAAPLLLPIMAGAMVLDTIPTIVATKHPKSATAWISNILCTPEMQLSIILIGLTLYYWLYLTIL